MVTASTAEVYRCPGEEYDITRAVHLARLAMSYSKCRHCRHAPGACALPESAEAEADLPPLPHDSLFTAEGVRGRYLNDLTRATAGQIAGAMASCLWDDFVSADPSIAAPRPVTMVPGDAQSSNRAPSPSLLEPLLPGEGVRLLSAGRPGPMVVLAQDERHASADMAAGVGQALRRMGCHVVDIGLATRPGMLFAVDHLRAAGAVHVTGAGCDSGWTGLDFLTRGGVPSSSPGDLDRIAARLREGFTRPSRRSGSQRTFPATVPYEAGFLKYFHALRPLKIAFACSSRTVHDLFARVFRKVACRLLVVETPTRARSALDPTDPDLRRLSQHVRDAGAHLGVLVEDDAERCIFFDEGGRFVAPALMAALLASENGNGPRDAFRDVPVPVRAGDRPPSREEITLALRRDRAPFAADGAGRYWFAEACPACDALLTLVHVLQALSRSDAPFSEVVGTP
jgi:phosphomannomutase